MPLPSDWHLAKRSCYHYFILNSADDLKSSVVFPFFLSFLTRTHIKAAFPLLGFFFFFFLVSLFPKSFAHQNQNQKHIHHSGRKTQDFSRVPSKYTPGAYLLQNSEHWPRMTEQVRFPSCTEFIEFPASLNCVLVL